MLSLLSEVHFWTNQDDLNVKDSDYGSFKYHSKNDNNESFYIQSKKLYCEKRGISWVASNKRPTKLKERLKELETYLEQYRVINATWSEEKKLLLIFSSGLIVTVTLNEFNSDIELIRFDKSLLQLDNIVSDGFVSNSQIILICTDGKVVGQVNQRRDTWTLDGGFRRHLSCHQELLVIWGRAGIEHPQPWSPITKDHQRANLLVYWIGSRNPELLAYRRTEGEPIEVVVSKNEQKTLLIVEQKVSVRGAVSVDSSALELNGTALRHKNQGCKVSSLKTIVSIPLQTQVCCAKYSPDEERLLLGCIDGSVALLDRRRGATQVVRASFIPTLITWHPDGAVAALATERGQIQYFDTSLACVKSQLVSEDITPFTLLDLSGYTKSQPGLMLLSWGHTELLLALERGPLAVITHTRHSLTFVSLAQRYIIAGRVALAIGLLLSMDWDSMAAQCLSILQRIVAFLLKQPLTDEIATQLQSVLGSFHSSVVPINAETRRSYGPQVIGLTRRFFHQLIRTGRYETAFLLAIDLAHYDLFMDLHHIALNIGERELAAAAHSQASSLISRCSSAASSCSRSSCSQCSTGESSEDNSSPLKYNMNGLPPPPLINLPIPHLRPQIPNYVPAYNLSSQSYSKILSQPYSSASTTSISATNQAYSSNLKSSNHFNPLPLSSPYVSGTAHSNFMASLNLPPVVAPLIPPPIPQLPSVNTITYPVCQAQIPPIPQLPPPPLPVAPPLVAPPMRPLKMPWAPLPAAASVPVAPVSPPMVPPMPLEDATASGSNGNRKPAPKVKFSDTVTAFIVPEVKRAVRPAPPSHLTDTRRELAESLPLCHPNEDYLKDFTPVRRSEQNEQPTQSKIKVVHFGVV